MGQPSGHGVARDAFAAAAATPLVVLDDAAAEDGTVRIESLAGDDEAELVESAEGRQIGVGERVRAVGDGRVGHVAVLSG